MVSCASGLFYHPDRISYSNPSSEHLKYESIFFKSIDGTKLHAWYIPAVGDEKGVVIHFHGNSQNISGHFSLVSWLPREGYSLFMFDYRGYGLSEGKPDREGLHLDSISALNFVFDNPNINNSNIFVLGQSLGGANAIDAVSAIQGRNIKALVIESTFVSYQDIALEKSKSVSFVSGSFASSPSLLTTDKHSPKDNIRNIAAVPILFIHGTEDKVIPLRHSKELYEQALEPKSMWVIDKGRHLDAFAEHRPEMKESVLEYFEQYRDKNTF